MTRSASRGCLLACLLACLLVGSVLVTDDAVWVSAFNDNVVHRVDPGP